MANIVKQIRDHDKESQILCNMKFDREKFLYVQPMVLDLPLTEVGQGLKRIYTENIRRFSQFLDLLLDPESLYKRLYDISQGKKVEREAEKLST